MQEVDKLTVSQLERLAEEIYGSMLKSVVDIEQNKLLINMEMHVDGEQFCLENGSSQKDLWGINLYPDKFGTDDFIEFDSMINIRPKQNNFSRTLEDKNIRKQIRGIVADKIHK